MKPIRKFSDTGFGQVFYSVRDPRIIQVLDIMKQYFYAELIQGQAVLDEIKAEAVNS